jgi:hypothetical protein
MFACRRATAAIRRLSTEIVAFSPALGYVVDHRASQAIGGPKRNDGGKSFPLG